MFKKRTQKGQAKRAAPEATGDQPQADIVKRPEKQARGQRFATKSDDKDDEDALQASAVFASSRTTAPVEHRGGAFAYGEVDTEADKDTRAVLERNLELQKTEGDGTYRGQAGYKSYVKKDEAQIGANKYTGTKGPIRAPQFVRNTCRFDYQPDVCKDYKDTGFCGYGDSCKFMHDRGDYKTGWQLEAEYQRQKERDKEREMLGKLGEPDSDDEREANRFRVGAGAEELPFACHLCRGPFRDPIVTPCQHYFCANCALSRHRAGESSCAICGKQTSGLFNQATKLNAHARRSGALGGP